MNSFTTMSGIVTFVAIVFALYVHFFHKDTRDKNRKE
jgi:hypothetical protein